MRRLSVLILLAVLGAAEARAARNPSYTETTGSPDGTSCSAGTGYVLHDLSTASTWKCTNESGVYKWRALDLPKCSPDPPSGACTGNPVCQTAASGLYYCASSTWTQIAGGGGGIPGDAGLVGLANGAGGSTSEQGVRRKLIANVPRFMVYDSAGVANGQGMVCAGNAASGLSSTDLSADSVCMFKSNSGGVLWFEGVAAADGKYTVLAPGAVNSAIQINLPVQTGTLALSDAAQTWTGAQTYSSTATFNGTTTVNGALTAAGPNTLNGTTTAALLKGDGYDEGAQEGVREVRAYNVDRNQDGNPEFSDDSATGEARVDRDSDGVAEFIVGDDSLTMQGTGTDPSIGPLGDTPFTIEGAAGATGQLVRIDPDAYAGTFGGYEFNPGAGLRTVDLDADNLTADRTYQFPDESGTLLVGGSISTSAELAAMLSDETGTGVAVFGTAPTLSNVTVSDGAVNSSTVNAIWQTNIGASSGTAFLVRNATALNSGNWYVGADRWDGSAYQQLFRVGRTGPTAYGFRFGTNSTDYVQWMVNGATSTLSIAGAVTDLSVSARTSLTNLKNANGAEHSNAATDIATARGNLPSADGLLFVDPSENDTTTFAKINPAGVDKDAAATGKKDALSLDTRDGRFKFLTSAPPPWGSAAGAAPQADESGVPFVVQPRYHDSTDLLADDGFDGTRDGDSWSGGPDIKTCSTTTARKCIMDSDCPGAETCSGAYTDEWRTLPTGHITAGAASTDKTYWYTGQCNTLAGNSQQQCGGQAIFQVRAPEIDDGDGTYEAGEQRGKPVLSVGTGGVGIYMPDSASTYYESPFTIFHGEDSYFSSTVYNMPFFAITRAGMVTDGGTFMGNSRAFPRIGIDGHTYPAFNAWVQHDIGDTLPAFVVEGQTSGAIGYETGPLAFFLNRSGYSGTDHTISEGVRQEVALGIYSNSVLRLAATCDGDADGCTGTVDDSQYIEWEGATADANETKVTVTEPTADRNVKLPDASGTVVTTSATTTAGVLMWGDAADATDTGSEVCALSGLTCVDVKSPAGVDSDCATDQGTAGTYFYALCRRS
jgi:hypothetical protein